MILLAAALAMAPAATCPGNTTPEIQACAAQQTLLTVRRDEWASATDLYRALGGDTLTEAP